VCPQPPPLEAQRPGPSTFEQRHADILHKYKQAMNERTREFHQALARLHAEARSRGLPGATKRDVEAHFDKYRRLFEADNIIWKNALEQAYDHHQDHLKRLM
ncbi:hypothetical protein TSOC_000556, partial [Tetrabaena socialis]